MPPHTDSSAVPVARFILDKEREIRFDMVTLEAVEEEFDQGFFDVLQEMHDPTTGRMRWATLRRFVSACLRIDAPEATPEWVGRYLHLGNVRGVVDALKAAVNRVAGEEPAEEPESGKPTGSGGGGGTATTSA